MVSDCFDPFYDMNSIQLVKDKLREMGWQIIIDITADGVCCVTLILEDGERKFTRVADTESRAICEAAIKAVEGKC